LVHDSRRNCVDSEILDIGGNSTAASQHNLDLEGTASICALINPPAQQMTLPDHLVPLNASAFIPLSNSV
jgi:hypothetical protein